ncbi:MAG: hypothetical protein V4565_14710 [Bacteroidota bacterium]
MEFFIDKNKFVFEHLPKYAEYLLAHQLDEFVTIGIRFAREIELPLMKPLSKLPEEELVKMSLDSNKLQLQALINNTYADFIEFNLNNWVNNQLGTIKDGKGVVDKSEVLAEDLTLAFYIRRKLFSYFLYGYTQNVSIRQLIINEVDQFTTYEELASLKLFFKMQKEII